MAVMNECSLKGQSHGSFEGISCSHEILLKFYVPPQLTSSDASLGMCSYNVFVSTPTQIHSAAGSYPITQIPLLAEATGDHRRSLIVSAKVPSSVIGYDVTCFLADHSLPLAECVVRGVLNL